MSAVSNKVMPCSMARSITRCDASFGIILKLLQPRPTTETSRLEVPSFRFRIEVPFERVRESLRVSAHDVVQVPQQGASIRQDGPDFLAQGAHLGSVPAGL